MARDGSGNFSLAEAAFVNGTTIDADVVNSDLSDIAAGVTGSMARNGEAVPTASQPMGGFHHTGVGLATARTDYARADQVIGSVLDYAIDTGTATAYAIAPSPGISAYVVGQRFAFKAIHANSGADPTLAVNGLTAGIIYNPDGTSLVAADITLNGLYDVLVASVTTGTPTFHLQSQTAGVVRKGGTQTVTGAKTFSATLAMSGAAINEAIRVDVASATTCDIGAAASNYVRITGTVTITGLGTVASGARRKVVFGGILTLTHNATSLILPTGLNITTAAGDCAEFESEGSGNWRCTDYTRSDGTPLAVSLSRFANSLPADVNLNNTANYFTGPTVAQGTTGTWFASGSVSVAGDPSDTIYVKLWDGTTVVASAVAGNNEGGTWTNVVALSGCITNPAGNLRISCRDITSTAGIIRANVSGESKDSTLSALRIA